MSDATPAKAKSRLWSRLAILATIAIVGYVGWRWATAESVYVAKAELWVTKRMAPVPVPKDDSRGGVVDDFASTHMVLLKSPYIIDRAVEKGNLKSLTSLEDAPDPVTAIQGMLRVSRNETAGGPGAPILTIKCRGSDGEDCEKIIEAVFESYTEFLNMTYRNASNDAIRIFMNTRDSLEREIKEAQLAHAKFRKDWPAANSRGDSIDDFRTLVQKLLENRLRQQEINVQIEQIQAGRDTIPMQIKVREWAKSTGFDALPEQVRKDSTATTAYIESLRAELASVRYREVLLKELKEAQLGEMRDAMMLRSQDDKLKNEVLRLQKMFDTTLQKLYGNHARPRSDWLRSAVFGAAQGGQGAVVVRIARFAIICQSASRSARLGGFIARSVSEPHSVHFRSHASGKSLTVARARPSDFRHHPSLCRRNCCLLFPWSDDRYLIAIRRRRPMLGLRRRTSTETGR